MMIRCPDCGQRFKVGEDLEGKMVECGTCEHRFRVTESVMLRRRKFYPGEQRDESLGHFSRVPLQSVPTPEFEAIESTPDPNARATIEPISPARALIGVVGVLVALVVGLILLLGGGSGSTLEGVSLTRRVVLGGFAGVLCTVLLMLASPARRLRAGGAGIGILVLLLALPLVFRPRAGEADLTGAEAGTIPLDELEETAPPAGPFAELKDQVGYDRVAEALERYGVDGEIDGKTAIGIWLRNTQDYTKMQIVDYLNRAAKPGPQSWTYQRPPNDYLSVLYDVPADLEAMQQICERFGTVTRVIRELQLIEVEVDNDLFTQGSDKPMRDPTLPGFYQLNYRELNSIDLKRAEAAVKRLARAEPKVLRADIVTRMIERFEEGDVDMKEHVARALLTWAGPDDDVAPVIRAGLQEILEKDQRVPSALVEFLVQAQDRDSVSLVHQLWREDSSDWESLYGQLGTPIEEPILKGMDTYSPLQLISAARLLGRVGTRRSLAALEAAKAKASSELRVTLDQAIESIQQNRNLPADSVSE